ncbi:MAG: DUF6074 family protein [Rhizobiaceae bacterium]
MSVDRDLPDLPLFQWKQPTRFIPYPLNRQVGKIREVARKLTDKPTPKTAANYRQLITDNLNRKLTEYGVPESRQKSMIASFWTAVEQEVLRLTSVNPNSGDGVA